MEIEKERSCTDLLWIQGVVVRRGGEEEELPMALLRALPTSFFSCAIFINFFRYFSKKQGKMKNVSNIFSARSFNEVGENGKKENEYRKHGEEGNISPSCPI
jgi:hypothetical protein